jgi:hypothetical protein
MLKEWWRNSLGYLLALDAPNCDMDRSMLV